MENTTTRGNSYSISATEGVYNVTHTYGVNGDTILVTTSKVNKYNPTDKSSCAILIKNGQGIVGSSTAGKEAEERVATATEIADARAMIRQGQKAGLLRQA